MKKLVLTSFLIVFMFSLLPAQDNENTILIFDGGETNTEFSFYWQVLSQTGQSIAFRSKGTWDVWSNPASFVAFDQSYINFSMMPGFKINPSDHYDVDNEIQQTVDDALVDYRANGTLVEYPKLNAKFGQQGGLYGFQVALPFYFYDKKTVVSMKVGQPIYIDLDVINDGIVTLIETKKAVGDNNMLIHMKMDMQLQTKFTVKSTDYQLRLAHQLNDKLALGIEFGNTQIHTFMNDKVITNGIMEVSGTEYAFNDPNDPHIDFENGQTNTLDQSLFLDFTGSSWKLQVGGLYKVTNRFVVGMDYTYQSTATMKGDMEVKQYKIPALNFEAMGDNSDEELVDPTLLNLAALTLTEEVENKTSDKMEMMFPSALEFQFSFQGETFQNTLALSKYFNSFGYNFLDEKQYNELNFGINYSLAWGFFKLSAGGIFGDIIRETKDKKEITEGMIIPSGAMEFAFKIKSIHWSNRLFFSPTPGVGISLGYFF